MTLFAPRGELAHIALGEKLSIDRGTTALGPLAVTFDAVTNDAAHGHIESDGRRVALTITLAGGRARAVDLRFEPPFSVDHDGAEETDAVFAAWAEALASHVGAKPRSSTARRIEYVVRKPYVATFELIRHNIRGADGERAHSVTLRKWLDASVQLPADEGDSWFDLDAVAPLLVSKKFNESVVRERAIAHFAAGTLYSQSAAWQQVVFAARASHGKRAWSVYESLLTAMSWANLDRARWFFSYVCAAHAGDLYASKRFASVPIHTTVALIERIDPPVSERGPLAVTIGRALEQGEPESMRTLAARLAAKPGAKPPFNVSDEIAARLTAVLEGRVD